MMFFNFFCLCYNIIFVVRFSSFTFVLFKTNIYFASSTFVLFYSTCVTQVRNTFFTFSIRFFFCFPEECMTLYQESVKHYPSITNPSIAKWVMGSRIYPVMQRFLIPMIV